LAVEGVYKDPLRSTPAVVAELREPFGDDSRLARASFRVENEDAHSAFAPGVVESSQLSFAPGKTLSVGAQHVQSMRDRAGER